MTGTGGQQRVPSSFFERFDIPFPLLAEQKRLADILDQADTIRRKRLISLEFPAQLIRSLFGSKFGDCIHNKKRWPIVSLEDLCGAIVDCPHSTPIYVPESKEYLCARSADIRDDGYFVADRAYGVSKEEFKCRIARHRPKAGEVLYTREGGRLGYAAQIPNAHPVCLGQRMMLFVEKPGVSINSFLWALLNSEAVRHRVRGLTAGAAAPRINISDLRELTVFRPPYSAQEEFDAQVNRTNRLRGRWLSAAADAHSIFNALVQQAFDGRL